MQVDKAKRYASMEELRAALVDERPQASSEAAMARIDAFLKLGLAQGCSDIHLAVGIPPMLRLHGDLMPIKFRDLGDTELEGYVDEILSTSQKERFHKGQDLDFSYVSGEGGRFRVNVFRKATGIGATFRNIPSQIADARQPRACRRSSEVLRSASGHGARHGLDGHG